LKESLVLALDIGTSSVRAALYDASAKRLEETFVKNERTLNFTETGGAELDAETALTQVGQAIDEVLLKAKKSAERIELVTASCFWHSLIGVGENWKALTPVLTWADTRSAKYVEVLREHFNEREIHNRTGCRFHPSYWTAKLLWFREEQPEIFNKVHYWLSFGDLFALHSFHQAVTSVSMASGTGIFDIRKCDWDEELINFLGIKREQLPRIAADGETFQQPFRIETHDMEPIAYDERLKHTHLAGLIRNNYLSNAKSILAIGDGAANNVGAHCVEKNKAALMIGTSGAMRVIYEGEPPQEIPSGLWCYRLDRKRVILGGALSDGGGLYRWLKDSFQYDGTDDELEEKIANQAPDSHGLTVLPFWSGERSTNWNADARGAILGLTPHTTPIEIMQAVLEAVAYRFAAIFEQLNQNCRIKEVIASGGALRESPVWTQIICDTLNRKMFLPDEREASSRGAVLFALEKAGKINNIADFPTNEGQAFLPNAAKHEIYQKAKQRQEKFYNLILPANL
jgi:gluconokinase